MAFNVPLVDQNDVARSVGQATTETRVTASKGGTMANDHMFGSSTDMFKVDLRENPHMVNQSLDLSP